MGRDYDGSMGLALVVGPAKAGKIARLLEGYLAAIEHDPVLIVPNRADVDRIERDLLQRAGALLAGSIGTFDDVFRELAPGGADARPVASDAQRTLVARRVSARTPLNGLGRSARFGGFADALLAALGELESGLLDPEQLGGDLGLLYTAYRASSTGSGSGIATCCGAAPSSGFARSSTPGTAARSSPTASRT